MGYVLVQVDIPAQLEAVDRETLTRPIRRMLQSDTVELLDWQFRPLRGGSGNPVSLGLYRFAGSGRDQGKAVPWSLALKVAQSPANVGATDMGEGEDQTHWNYWKREMYVYQSALLDSLPEGLAAPRCFGVEERRETSSGFGWKRSQTSTMGYGLSIAMAWLHVTLAASTELTSQVGRCPPILGLVLGFSVTGTQTSLSQCPYSPTSGRR